MRFTSTAIAIETVNCLVYGPSGVGKTSLCGTLSKPVIVSSEKKTMAIASLDIPVIEIDNIEDFREAHKFLKKNLSDFNEIFVDSATDIAATCLSDKKLGTKDTRKAFYDTQDEVMDVLRKIRDLPIATCIVAQHDIIIDAGGSRLHGPVMPSKTMSQQLPYLFDVVLAMRIDPSSKKNKRHLLTGLTNSWYAKDSSNSLADLEKPNLGAIFTKIKNSLKDIKNNGKGKKGKKGKKG
jgi:hypothetical protein